MEDRMVWPHERNGQFSVRSYYRYILAQIGTQFAEGSNVQTQHILWKHLWKMKVPNKVKIFAWRARKNGLPTGQQLVKKHVLSDGTCSLCLSELETLAHAVMSCNAIHKMWELYLHVVSIANNMSVMDVALQFCDRKLYDQLATFFMLMWSFWFRRNKYVHEKVTLSPKQVADNALTMLHSFDKVKPKTQIQLKNHYRWQHPPAD
ncbi:uncharacterized protein LOC121249426 [Juglans microcarpa x Juglans regia]|uniref:uncharacterized protein LOC121249426 n=1 Tax=Juglans microcarpa x Juglans regia TaxID=2249226 RepID=UPI001B7EC658|nr:uncharacterized protein LOC121249426 [Juglans microcarpa x Juglans regia]